MRGCYRLLGASHIDRDAMQPLDPARQPTSASKGSPTDAGSQELRMRFGIFTLVETRDGDYQKAYKEVLGQIEYAEELGFDNVWLAEHHGSRYGSMPSPPGLCGGGGPGTEEKRIGDGGR